MIKWITPSLAVCTEGDLPVVLNAMEVGKAADWIRDGGDAYVDSDDTAIEVLAELGLTADEILDRMAFANHRVIL